MAVGDNTELLLLPSLAAHRAQSGKLVLTHKYLNGAAEYAKTWPGPVTTLVRVSTEPSSDMDHVEVDNESSLTRVEERPADEAALAARLRKAAVVFGFLGPDELGTARICNSLGVPFVVTSEYSPETERQIVDSVTTNPILRWRRKLWIRGAERKRRALLKLCAGLQCSGIPAYEAYIGLQPDALLFFDNRVPVQQVISHSELARKASDVLSGRPLRLCFGGRLIAMKGVLQLPLIALALKDLGVAFQLDIYGRGELESKLATEIQRLSLTDCVAMRGVLDFETGWVPTLQQQVDLFVCCHPQSDPSSTYPEVMSCGVPIAGYSNRAFTGIVETSGSGWASPINDPEALARIIQRLNDNRTEIVRAAEKARTFAAQHCFESTFSSRSKHLIGLSRLPSDQSQSLP